MSEIIEKKSVSRFANHANLCAARSLVAHLKRSVRFLLESQRREEICRGVICKSRVSMLILTCVTHG